MNEQKIKNIEEHYHLKLIRYKYEGIQNIDLNNLEKYRGFIVGFLQHHKTKNFPKNIITSLRDKGLKQLGGDPKHDLTLDKLIDSLKYNKRNHLK